MVFLDLYWVVTVKETKYLIILQIDLAQYVSQYLYKILFYNSFLSHCKILFFTTVNLCFIYSIYHLSHLGSLFCKSTKTMKGDCDYRIFALKYIFLPNKNNT